jgi:hypothetical protein
MHDQQPELKFLDAFVGRWKTTGAIKGSNGEPDIGINGSDIYEWLPGGFSLLHKVDVYMGNERNQTIEIIGFDKAANAFKMYHFDNKGGSGTLTANVRDGAWTFSNESLRFTGKFSEDGNVLSGSWEQCGDGKSWSRFIDIKLVKQ